MTDAWNEPWPDTTRRWPKPPRRREGRQWYPGRNLLAPSDDDDGAGTDQDSS